MRVVPFGETVTLFALLVFVDSLAQTCVTSTSQMLNNLLSCLSHPLFTVAAVVLRGVDLDFGALLLL